MAFTSFEMMDGRWMADSGFEGLRVRVNVDRVGIELNLLKIIYD
jgi:hypothetical protein